VLINAVMDAGTRVPLAPAADVAADVLVGVVAAACDEGTVVPVWGFGRVGTRGLCVEERECDSRESGECSREETCGGRWCRRLCTPT
jgi:hypothetical protein